MIVRYELIEIIIRGRKRLYLFVSLVIRNILVRGVCMILFIIFVIFINVKFFLGKVEVKLKLLLKCENIKLVIYFRYSEGVKILLYLFLLLVVFDVKIFNRMISIK